MSRPLPKSILSVLNKRIQPTRRKGMDYNKILESLKKHPGLRDGRQARVARLLFKVCRKIRRTAK